MTHPKNELVDRLARIEGQVAALKRALIEGEPDCTKTLMQVKAASGALKHFGEAFAREYAKRCFATKKNRTHLSNELDTIIMSAFNLS